MPPIEKHKPGSFCWIELATTDQNAAKNFYGSLFGWTVNDSPMGPGEFYSDLFGWKMMKDEHDEHGYLHIVNGEDFIGGIPPTNPRTVHMPPHWLAYFAVADCDASAAKAKQLGARFYMEPMTMENVGRF